jgi:hypothetical protein
VPWQYVPTSPGLTPATDAQTGKAIRLTEPFTAA